MTRSKLRWSRADTVIALVTILAGAAFYGLAISPGWVRITVIVTGLIAYFCGLWWAFSRPITETDRELDRLDQELDRREVEARRVRRLERQRAREDSPIRHVGGGWRVR